MKRIVKFGKRKFLCELKKVAVRGGIKTVEKKVPEVPMAH